MTWKSARRASKAEITEFFKVHRKKTRFLLDENVGIELASQLRELGLNVKHVDEVGLGGRPDKDVFVFARKENRVILTHDDDFMDYKQFPINLSPGVVKIPGGSGDEEALVKAVDQVIVRGGGRGGFYMKTKISISPEGVWTINRFNQKTGKIEKTRLKIPENGPPMEWVET
jgi:Domain of unknown function (DUF5615)